MEILITDNSDEVLFRKIAKLLLENYKIQYIEKLEGLDQSYLDFNYKNNKYTLHREHYIGISLITENEKNDLESIIKDINTCILK